LAEIVPFKGIRYNTAVVKPDDVTSPPYDVISPEDLALLLARHPRNVVRLILGEELSGDNEASNRYTRAANCLEEWLSERTLVRDSVDSFYVYEQRFTQAGKVRTVRGFAALVKLRSYDEEVVLPHEFTLARPKSHLVPLIKATNANLDSIYGLFPDPDHNVDAILDRIAETEPAEEATDRQGVRHRLWVLQDKASIAAITSALADKPIVIADGHHRYETSLAYRDAMREKDGNPTGEQPYDYVMMTLVNLHSPDLVVLPTHRMVRNLPQNVAESLIENLSNSFELLPSSINTLESDMQKYGGKAIGVYYSGNTYLAVKKSSNEESTLDVFVLHADILETILGIDSRRLREGSFVNYTRDMNEAIAAVDGGDFQAAFVLNPISLDAMLNAVRSGKRMPQKSTYFYPKLLSGFVMRRIE
jgi:uncharacterized protein (DUF1015 family)